MQFVLLEHRTLDGIHWDLMIEVGSTAPLRSWRLLHDPTRESGEIDAVPIGDHRREYLEYEGPISGGRGHVRRIDRGEAQWLEAGPENVRVVLHGALLRGTFQIRATGSANHLFSRPTSK